MRIDETVDFTCARCAAGEGCMVCKGGPWQQGGENVHETNAKGEAKIEGGDDVEMKEDMSAEPVEKKWKPFFRCYRCKQTCHYGHCTYRPLIARGPPSYLRAGRSAAHDAVRDPFQDEEKHDLNDIAEAYQKPFTRNDPWTCHCCREWIWTVDMVSGLIPFRKCELIVDLRLAAYASHSARSQALE